jgi:Cof subfamily protein (haloacid dehalogenase superfamily)
MIPKLYAFDLDGTLLTSEKTLSSANAGALREMAESGAIVALASGRLGSSMMQFVPKLSVDPAMVTLNGAEVYMDSKSGSRTVYHAPLPAEFADTLVKHAVGKEFAINYYIDGRLYSVCNDRTQRWIDLYHEQTRTVYNFVDSLRDFDGDDPSKVIFVGDPADIDEEEARFRELWGDALYICRTWDYYVEFLNAKATKGNGLTALAHAYGLTINDVVAFGDADNDIPMLEAAGLGIAMGNAPQKVKNAARRVSQWTNDQDGVAREWERIKRGEIG